jgi:glycosyltransferase involved in cell wall biosynthesis
MIKISVVIPAYNSATYLKDALNSVLSQTFKSHEIILVDDGSTDQTEEIARSYGDQIRYIKQKNQGSAAARNTGIHEATGDWVAFLDSDDLMLPDRLRKQVALIPASSNLAVVYSGFSYLYPNGAIKEMPAFPAKELWPALRYRTPILPSTSIVRRSALLEIGGFNPGPRSRLIEDWDLWFRLIRRYSVNAFQDVPESLVLYRDLPNSLSKSVMPMAFNSLHLLDTSLLDDLSGITKIIWKRKIEARIYYRLALSLRQCDDKRYWEFAIESFLKWPLWGKVVPFDRYKVLAHMLYKRLRNFRFDFRYWWPKRDCRNLVG